MGKDNDRRKTKIEWKKYNKKLVQRGTNTANFINELRKMEPEWKQELKAMNEGKKGTPFKYPNSMIILLEVFKILTLKSYRFIQGFSCFFLSVNPNYSAVQKRIVKFDLKILNQMNINALRSLNENKIIHIIKDGTGIQINGRYVWIDKRFNIKRKRKWKKIDITIDLNTLSILSLRVLDESANEGKAKEFKGTIEEAKKNLPPETKIEKVYGDGSFDSNKNFEYCKKNGIEPIIRIRKPTREKIRRKEKIKKGMLWTNRYLVIEKSSVRDRYAEEQIDWEKFVSEKGYGKRSGIEGFIGSFKGFYGEKTNSRLDRSIDVEFSLKTILWNKSVLG